MDLKERLVDLVIVDGQLDATRISRSEAIYTARSGKQVERFIYEGTSYIFKPCSPATTLRERWVQQFLIPSIEGLKVPLVLASGRTQDPLLEWIIYEDLGSLIHCSHVEDVIRAAEIIPLWQRIPTTIMPLGAKGHSPDYSQVLEIITTKKHEVSVQLEASGISVSTMTSWWSLLPIWESFIQACEAVSHGDYYRLNIAFQNRDNIVLDWEFAHVNCVYWDLYSLIDITSHRYSRIQLHPADREAVLSHYWMSGGNEIIEKRYNDFIQGYYVFASVYSVWILTLIEADLLHARASVENLYRQQQETKSVLCECLRSLNI